MTSKSFDYNLVTWNFIRELCMNEIRQTFNIDLSRF